MKIYHVWQNSVTGFDTFSDAVIIAEGINRAKRISIEELCNINSLNSRWPSDIDVIHAKEIGVSKELKERIVVSSFHAG